MGKAKATKGIGTTFWRWTNSSAWIQIANVISEMGGPEKSRDAIEVTTFDSDDNYKEFLGGMKESGDFTVKMHFDRTNYDLIDTDFESDTPGNYKIVFPDTATTTVEFEALCTKLGFAIDMGAVIENDVTFKITGKFVTENTSSGA
jgi:predicted secreted protein